MDLNYWVKVFDRLLPDSRVWNLVYDRILRKFFHGLSILPQTVRDDIAAVLAEAFPATTSYLPDWSEQFGSMSDLTAEQLAAEWADTGGQTPQYLQDILHAAGFENLYVHEWWVPGSNPVTARNPIALVPTSVVLVNDITRVEKNFLHYFGDGTQFGDGSEFGAFNGYTLIAKEYPTPDNPDHYPYYFYIGGQTWPDLAAISSTDYRKVIRLIYKIKPTHLRCILRAYIIGPTEDGDILDTIYSDDEIQDTIDSLDEIQDEV